MDKEEISKILLKIKAVSLRTNPPYKWVSGILAPIYTDNRLIMSYPKERKKIISAFIKLIKGNKIKVDVIAGIATSGIPYAAWIAEELNIPMVYIRKKEKDHGKENLIEGKLDKGKTVVIIEDLISTGGSSINGVEAVRSAGCKVNYCLAIFTYELDKARQSFERLNVKIATLTDFTTLVKAATKENYIRDDEKEKVLEWSKNPEGWGR
ncbi:orotate phosphoribosyltransferase [Candidatus Woesearchaeota archaeon]|nr:orotate phosphoribosyltransferase [Candidatus Woesearchaeota archaeon]